MPRLPRVFSRFAPVQQLCYFVSLTIGLSLLLPSALSAQCPNVEVIMVDACPIGAEEENEYVIINSGGGFNLGDLTIDYASGNNTIGVGNSNNDLNTNVDNEPSFPAPCMLVPGDLSVYTGGCNLVAVGAGAAIPPNVLVIFQASSDPSFSIDLSVLCAMGQTIYVTRSDCDRTIGAFTNGGSGLRTTNFGFGAGCTEAVTYDRGNLVGGNGAYYGPGIGYGNNADCSPPDVSITNTCPPAEDQSYELCVDGPVVSPPQSLVPAQSLYAGASAVSFHTTAANAMNDVGEVTTYGGSTASPVTYFARVEYADGCVVIGTLTLTFRQPDGNAGSNATLATCSSASVDLLGALGGGVTAGSFMDNNGSGVSLANPSNVDFTEVPTGTYNFTYTTNDDPGTACPPDMATVTVNVTASPMANVPSDDLIICYTVSPPSYTSNLTTIQNQVSGGLSLDFYLDAAGTMPIDPDDPADQALLIALQPSVIYASYTQNGCPSNIVAIGIITEENPEANGPQSLTACNTGNGMALFDLTSLNGAINGGTGNPVSYFFDAAGNLPINNPAAHFAAQGTAYAIVNANGNCPSESVSITLNVSNGADVASMFTDPLCNGGASGTISLNINSGTPPYTFNWNPATLNGQEDPENLLAGDYFVTVTDASGCPNTLAFTLSDPPQLVLSNCGETTAASTPTSADGVASVTVSGGTGNYTVNYTGPSSGSVSGSGPQLTISGLLPGDYTITSVTDANNCSLATSCQFTITAPVPCDLVLQCGELSPASGAGNADGVATLVYGNGVAPYTIDVTGPTNVTLTNQSGGLVDVNNLLPGNYTVTLTDSDNCTETCTFTITATTVSCDLMVAVDTIIQIDCVNDSTGRIELTVSGVNGPLDIQWSDGRNEDSLFLDSLAAGTYSVTITDQGAASCSVVLTDLEIEVPTRPGLQAFELQPASDSFSLDGIAGFIVTGGTPPYDLSITGPLDTLVTDIQQDTFSVGGLPHGEYTAFLLGYGGCDTGSVVTFIITVAQPCGLSVQLDTIISPPCSGENGTITIDPLGGSGQYTISWSEPGFDDQTTISVPAGTYAVTVTDQTDTTCVATLSGLVVTEPAPLLVACFTGAPASGPTATDGSGSVEFSGGVGPYMIILGGAGSGIFPNIPGPDFSFDNLGVGVYDVTVIDANGCDNACQFTVTEQGCTLDVMFVASDISCNGDQDGTISLLISGNNGAVFVDWDQDQYDGQQDLSQLPAGSYSAVVTDNSGCTIPVGPIVINEPEVLDVACSVLNDVSNPNAMDGTAQGIVTGGTAPYTVILRRLIGGNQSINDTVTLALADTVLRNDLNGSDPAQQYEFVVIDASGCRDTCSFEIFEAPCPALFIQETITPVACTGDSSGRIAVTVVNAQEPITYEWTPSYPDTNVLDNLPAGNYQLVVTDSFMCTAAAVFVVTEPGSSPALSCMAVSDETVPGSADGLGQITITGDQPPFTVNVIGPVASMPVFAAAGTYDLTNLSTGDYMVVVTDNNGCTTDTCTFTIGVGACALVLETTVTDADCSGPGTIALSVSGGSAPYTFDWSDDTFDGMDTITAPNDIYSVTVTDAAGCTISTTRIIDMIDNAPMLQTASTMLACINDSARIDLMPSNGTAPYTYHFTTNLPSTPGTATSQGDTTVSFPIPNGTMTSFMVTVDSITDANGCVTLIDETTDYIVNAPDSLFFNGNRCLGDTIVIEGNQYFDGNASDTFFLSGGNCGLVYLIDYNFVEATVDTLEQRLCQGESLIVGPVVFDGNNLEGLVDFGVTASSGCDSLLYVRIDYFPLSQGNFSTSVCEGDTVTVGSDIYTVDDPNGVTVLTGAAATGCDSLVFVTVNFQPNGRVELVGDASICLGDTAFLNFETANGGPFDLVVRDGDGNTYNYGGVTNGSSFPVMPSNTTIFTLVSAEQGGAQCPVEYSGEVEISVSRLLGRLSVERDFAGFQISCFGANDGALLASVLEGIPPYEFTWSDSITGPSRTGLGPGNYEVSITDAAGCVRVYAENLQEPAPLIADPRVIPPGCNETDGFLRLDTIVGGVGPYEVTVDGVFFQSIQNFPYVRQLAPGDYNLQIRDMADCASDQTFTIPEPADPDLLLTPDTLIRLGDSLLLTAQTNFNPDSIRWEPGELLSATNRLAVFARPMETTRFQLTVSDSTGCRATASVLVMVDENVPIYIPTGFTPNGDGSNDLFQLYGNLGVGRVNVFRIFDRWGQMVYEAQDFDINDTSIGWDGKHRGEVLNPAVFVYYANVTLTDGRIVELKGDLTLLR